MSGQEQNRKLTWKERFLVYSVFGLAIYGAACLMYQAWAPIVRSKSHQEKIEPVTKKEESQITQFSIKLKDISEELFEDTLDKIFVEEKIKNIEGIDVIEPAYTKRKITEKTIDLVLSKLWSGFLKNNPEIKAEIEDNKYAVGVIDEKYTGKYGKELIMFNTEHFSDVKVQNFRQMDEDIHKKRIGQHDCPLECRLGEVVVHELFHDFWHQLLMEQDRKDFEKAIYKSYTQLEGMITKIEKLIYKTAGSMKNPEIEKLRELRFGIANYNRLFFDHEYRMQIACGIWETARYLNGLSEKSGFENVKKQLNKETAELFKLRDYLTGASVTKVKTYREDIIENIIQQHPDALPGIKTAEEFFALEELLGPKMKNYQKNVYKNESELTAQYFCGVEGFAFLADIVYQERNLNALPSEVRPLYKRFIDFQKLGPEK